MAKKKDKPKTGIRILIGNIEVTPLQAPSAETACTKCCFSFAGRPQRTCPKCETSETSVNLCVVLMTQSDGIYKNNTYFKEV